MTAAPSAAVAANSASVRSPLIARAPVGTVRPLRLTTTTSAPDVEQLPGDVGADLAGSEHDVAAHHSAVVVAGTNMAVSSSESGCRAGDALVESIVNGGRDTSLTAIGRPGGGCQTSVSTAVHACPMTADSVETVIRQAIGGDPCAISSILRQAETSESAVVLAMAALLERLPDRLDRARDVAATNRDRQVVELARAHLDGRNELVDALARDHLADHPDSLIVAWIASDAAGRSRGHDPL